MVANARATYSGISEQAPGDSVFWGIGASDTAPVVELVVANGTSGITHENIVAGTAEENAVSRSADPNVRVASPATVGNGLHRHGLGRRRRNLCIAGGVRHHHADIALAIGRNLASAEGD